MITILYCEIDSIFQIHFIHFHFIKWFYRDKNNYAKLDRNYNSSKETLIILLLQKIILF